MSSAGSSTDTAARTDTESKTNTVMEPYDAKIAPAPFPLNNTGVICHFNSLLQSLASQSVLVKTVLNNEEYLKKTGTGTAFLDLHQIVGLGRR